MSKLLSALIVALCLFVFGAPVASAVSASPAESVQQDGGGKKKHGKKHKKSAKKAKKSAKKHGKKHGKKKQS